MKQFNILMQIATKYDDCLIQIYKGELTVHTGAGNERTGVTCSIYEDDVIGCIIDYLNYGTSDKRPSEEIYQHAMRNDRYRMRMLFQRFAKLLDKDAFETRLEIGCYIDDDFELRGKIVELDGQKKIHFLLSVRNSACQPKGYQELSEHTTTDVSLQSLIDGLKAINKRYIENKSITHEYLLCNKCLYKQSDLTTVVSMRRRFPDKKLITEIPYYCGACQDTATDEEYKCMQAKMRCGQDEQNE